MSTQPHTRIANKREDKMKMKISLVVVMLLGATFPLLGQDTVFFSGFEYSDGAPFPFEPVELNGADDQVGEWSGDEFPEGVGDIVAPDAVGIIPSPYGGNLLVNDRPGGDADGAAFTGSMFADFSKSIGLIGAEVSFQVGTRRTGGNNNKDYDVIGRGSDGEAAFHLRVGTNNNGGERLGYVADGGDTVVFDLPTTVGEDRAADLDNTGGFNSDNGPGLGAEIANIIVRLGASGYSVDFSYPEEGTSGNANAYVTDILPYNGAAMDLAQVEFTYSASNNTGVNSGYVLDEVMATGFEELLIGDFNFDGTLDVEDFNIIKENLLTGTTFEQGDFNFDGQVTLEDFAGFKAAASAAGAAVPEPSGHVIFGVLLAGLAAFRRRSRTFTVAATCAIACTATSLHAADFDGRYVRVTGDQINNTAEALGILRGTAAPRTIVEDVRGKVELIDLGGGAGTFDQTIPYLNGTDDASKDDFLQQMTGLITIPAGDWTIGFGSDDGGTVIIPGVEFSARFNATAGTADDETRFNGTRGHGWTMGEFSLSSPLTTQIEAVFFERGGGDSFEVAILNDLAGSNDPTDFQIISDGVLGWEVLDFTPGDFDLNGEIDFTDFLTLANNFGTGNLYSQGDLNFSGRVDLGDFVAFRDIFLALPAGAPAAVPEPSTAVVLQIGLLAGLALSRKRRQA